MNLIYMFLIEIEDNCYIVHWGEKVLIPSSMYSELQKQGIPTLYYSDIAKLG